MTHTLISLPAVLSLVGLAGHALAQQVAEPPPPAPTREPATQQSVRARDSEDRDPAMGADEGDPRIDDQTGRAVQTFRKDRAFDFLHQRIELDIPDMGTAALSGNTTITATPIAYAQPNMVLDCDGPLVTAVRVDGQPARFAPAEKTVRVDFTAPIQPGRTVTVNIDYTLDFSSAKGEGLTWCAPRDNADSASSKVPMIHAQGEAQLNSRWFPCFDSPEERETSEVIVTVDSDYTVVSNGLLAEQAASTVGAGGKARTRWHWKQDKEHPPYLITVGIGVWSVVEVGGDATARPGLAMPVYALAGQEESVKKVFASTPEILAFFEKRFDEPFPWDKYAQVLVRCFNAGGMENTSATFLASRTGGPGEAYSRDDLISHEMAHQWFGDLVTCKGWEHLWLNEGWASYAESLWAEEHARRVATAKGEDGNAAARAEYLRLVGRTLRSMTRRAGGEAPLTPAVVSRRFYNPDAVFEKRDNPYSKGAMLLHMLREAMGDEPFFKATALYLDRHKGTAVETEDFRAACEETSGLSLGRFFEQWAYRPGFAKVTITPTLAGGTLTIKAEQTQHIDRLNPAYVLTLPVVVTAGDGTKLSLAFSMDSREATATFSVPADASRVDIDPSYSMLAAITPRAFNPATGEAIREPAQENRERRRGQGN
ncbi:MAG: M1 family metallopeptidase [Phycisphaerales bacterium]